MTGENILSFKKHKANLEDKIQQEALAIKAVDIQIAKETHKRICDIVEYTIGDGLPILSLMAPLHFMSNDPVGDFEIIKGFYKVVLENFLTAVTSQEFLQWMEHPELVKILLKVHEDLKGSFAVNINIPLQGVSFTFALIGMHGSWVICNVFLNEECIHQQAIEYLMEVHNLASHELFGNWFKLTPDEVKLKKIEMGIKDER